MPGPQRPSSPAAPVRLGGSPAFASRFTRNARKGEDHDDGRRGYEAVGSTTGLRTTTYLEKLAEQQRRPPLEDGSSGYRRCRRTAWRESSQVVGGVFKVSVADMSKPASPPPTAPRPQGGCRRSLTLLLAQLAGEAPSSRPRAPRPFAPAAAAPRIAGYFCEKVRAAIAQRRPLHRPGIA